MNRGVDATLKASRYPIFGSAEISQAPKTCLSRLDR
jgi:hypothetical protein